MKIYHESFASSHLINWYWTSFRLTLRLCDHRQRDQRRQGSRGLARKPGGRTVVASSAPRVAILVASDIGL